MNLVFSSVFEQDFAELVTFFSREHSPELAARFERSTYVLIEQLMTQPKMGRSRTELKPEGVRSFRVGGFERYLLFYLVRGDELILLRLRHGGMDLRALFLA